MQDDVHVQGAAGRDRSGEGGAGARFVPRPEHEPSEPLTTPWFDAMHEKRDELAKQLDGNLKQLKRVIDESKWISKQLEEVLEEIRTAGEDYTSSANKGDQKGRGGPRRRGADGADDEEDPSAGPPRGTRQSKGAPRDDEDERSGSY